MVMPEMIMQNFPERLMHILFKNKKVSIFRLSFLQYFIVSGRFLNFYLELCTLIGGECPSISSNCKTISVSEQMTKN